MPEPSVSPVSAAEARAALAAAQAELLAALVAGGRVPDGFDPGRVAVQARGLLAKRRGSVARAAPDLAEALGAEFAGLFAGYAAEHVKPEGGSRADARDFAAWLRVRGRL
ncbi:hypothetical protein [Microbispora siamensis]|uniref:SCO6045-like C-terminal domain-containing protein n=1 Tax=Microbispora siamensis TaxID=564413 RepID=A0ABQ4GP22_9ACTN|nr:hypothetical protein [Microbispora siamensis]GIH63189.1 hypothetical protein Msi02_40060 [Microbispora siamensis]